ncbi:MAG: Asp-tRNA(Asn)/Glu-tRNA(Gln) amidotransferase GatCAB subunit B [Acidobacteria bacterium]|nr:MAG: Asp-tRNA(Asn)/Glu-tRNA(Gln) amidotransferase GatCAB subunit B [Acidobacteriota bacterium]
MALFRTSTVIGLECHAQLLTKSKLFCSCSTKFGDPPNANTCPVCLGLPGALPVLNRVAVTMAVKAAIGLNCTINPESQWARKNYFYPDLPKGYQISQYDRPLGHHGFIEIKLEGKQKRIGVQRVHMEEDAGKSLHEGFPDSNRSTYLDFNRSGVPLIEIVSDPDIRSSAEAYDYLARLKQILEYLDVCDGNMDEGSLRCDANVSVRKFGDQKLGTRTELKNINSFRFVQKAIDYEVHRQIEVIESGGQVVQETRLWNSVEERTVSMRSKEEAHDYRYFPDPDLPLLVVDSEWIKTIQRSMPELPESRRERFEKEYALSEYDAGVLTTTRALADFFEETAKLSGHAKTAANWIMGDLLRFYKDNNVDLKDLSGSRVTPRMLAGMISLVDKGTISGKIAKTVMEEMYKSGKDPLQIIEEKGLLQISNTAEIEKIVNQVLEENPKPVEQYRLGKTGNFGFFVGQVMKATGGRANPQTVNEILKKRLAG